MVLAIRNVLTLYDICAQGCGRNLMIPNLMVGWLSDAKWWECMRLAWGSGRGSDWFQRYRALYHEWLRCIQQAWGPGSTVLGAGPDAKSDAPKSQVFGVLARRRAHVGRTLNTGAPSWPGCRLCTLNKSHHHHQVTIIKSQGLSTPQSSTRPQCTSPKLALQLSVRGTRLKRENSTERFQR